MRVLCFVDYYLPGYKAGGPIRTIANIVDHLGDELDFLIVTRDRDASATEAYANVLIDKWNTVGKAKVFYASPSTLSFTGLARLLRETPHNMLYLNSFLSPKITGLPLLIRRLGLYGENPVILAPRGEFSAGALKIKGMKKTAYIFGARLLGLYKNIMWQASSEHEARDIKRTFAVAEKDISVALDLPAKPDLQLPDKKNYSPASVSQGLLRLVFLSRISPKKNLDYALQVLSHVEVDVEFDIYGPLEDATYWRRCQSLIKELPPNVKVTYRGSLKPEKVAETFACYDLFLFPTHGENYGHVIAESLSVGTPVLLSDQTPWRDLSDDGLGWDLALENMAGFVEMINLISVKNKNLTQKQKMEIRRHVQHKVLARLTDPAVLEANRQLFYGCLPK